MPITVCISCRFQDILLRCWSYTPSERPDFSRMMKALERIPKRLFRSPSHPPIPWRSENCLYHTWWIAWLDLECLWLTWNRPEDIGLLNNQHGGYSGDIGLLATIMSAVVTEELPQKDTRPIRHHDSCSGDTSRPKDTRPNHQHKDISWVTQVAPKDTRPTNHQDSCSDIIEWHKRTLGILANMASVVVSLQAIYIYYLTHWLSFWALIPKYLGL